MMDRSKYSPSPASAPSSSHAAHHWPGPPHPQSRGARQSKPSDSQDEVSARPSDASGPPRYSSRINPFAAGGDDSSLKGGTPPSARLSSIASDGPDHSSTSAREAEHRPYSAASRGEMNFPSNDRGGGYEPRPPPSIAVGSARVEQRLSHSASEVSLCQQNDHSLPLTDHPRDSQSVHLRKGASAAYKAHGGIATVGPSYQLLPSPYARASVHMHSPSLGGVGLTSSTPEFSVFVGDLAPDLREEDLVTQFLHPPPWPPEHPFAIAYAHARKMQGEPPAPGELFGPAPFLSTKSAKVMTDPDTGQSKGFGFVRFTAEADCKRAFIEMQGVVLTPASGISPGRPVRISAASVKQKTGPATTPQQQPSTSPDYSMHYMFDGYDPPVVRKQDLEGSHNLPSANNASLSPASSSNTAKYSSPTAESIALQSSRSPQPSRLGVATLPGFPTIPATGALGPTDVGLSSGAMLSSSFGGPASLAGTGFTLGPSTLPSPTSALDPRNTTVFVGGLSSLISEETLKTFFAPFGMIAYVKIPPGKGCGFVSFTQKVDAERAIERMQGFPIGGCRIRLSWGRSQGEKNQHLAAQYVATSAQRGGHRAADVLSSNNGSQNFGSLTPQQAAQLARVANWSSVPSSTVMHGSGFETTSDPYFQSFGYENPHVSRGLSFDTSESRRLARPSTGDAGPSNDGFGRYSVSPGAADIDIGSPEQGLSSLFGGLSMTPSPSARDKWPSPWAPTISSSASSSTRSMQQWLARNAHGGGGEPHFSSSKGGNSSLTDETQNDGPWYQVTRGGSLDPDANSGSAMSGQAAVGSPVRSRQNTNRDSDGKSSVASGFDETVTPMTAMTTPFVPFSPVVEPPSRGSVGAVKKPKLPGEEPAADGDFHSKSHRGGERQVDALHDEDDDVFFNAGLTRN